MVKPIKIAIIGILLCLFEYTSSAQGLGFNGMDHRIEDRSSYDVFGKDLKTAKERLTICFDLRIAPGDQFGYILRVKDKVNWNLSYESSRDSVLIRLNEEGRKSHIKAAIAKKDLPSYRWHPVILDVDIHRDSLHLSIGEHHFSRYYDIIGPIRPQIIFGKSDFLIDVPSFAIRNLTVSMDKQKYRFNLSQINGEKVYDTNHRIKGEVVNPNWLTNEALEWKEIKTLNSKEIAGCNWNPVRKEFYYFNNNELFIHSFSDNETHRHIFNAPCPVKLKLGSSYISADGNYLYSYELYDEQHPSDWSVARLDLDTLEWTALSKDRLNMPMNHHTGFLDPNSGEYTVFGGFGNKLYNGYFYSFDDNTGRWHQTYQMCDIFPRYFSASGTDDDGFIYIFAGMGNECGEQVVGRKYFYDLHRINSRNGQIEKIWSLNWDEPDQVPVRKLIVDSDVFYTLCYPEYLSNSQLKLCSFRIDNGYHKVLGNSIPIISDKMRTNANLFMDKDMALFIAAVQVFDDDIRSELKLYTISYPAFSDDIIKEMKKGQILKYSLISIIVLALLSITLIALKKYRNKQAEKLSSRKKIRLFKQEQRNNAIYLFGDFTVIDNKGTDLGRTRIIANWPCGGKVLTGSVKKRSI